MNINITLKNSAELAAAFRSAPDIALPLFSHALERTAFKVEADAKRAAPVNKRGGGGNLRQSIRARMQSRLTGVVEVGAHYGIYVDQGTRPHVIVARGRGLANKRTGQFFGKRVNHPGTRATHFFSDAVKGNEVFMNQEFSSALDTILKTIH
jgi:HK97 gp10 family phage protein